jgi:mRNA interferase YafQ
MRRIERSTAFKKDFKRVQKGQGGAKVQALLTAVLEKLIVDEPLPVKNADHPLSGEWKDHRDCHIRPDLVLIYRKPDTDTLQLVRLGSHSELFGS